MAVTVTNGDSVTVSVTGGIGPTIIVNGTSTSVVGSIGVQPFIAGQNVTITTTGGGISILAANPPVASVQGKVGTISLSVSDLTAAAEVHTHSTSQISLFTTAVRGLNSVFSVQGKTGTVTLTVSDITAAAATHTHTLASLGAAAASHTHVAANITDFAANVPVKTVNGMTGDVVINSLPSQSSNAGLFLTTDGTAPSWAEVIPPQAGSSGSVLSTNGESLNWSSGYDVISSIFTSGSNISIAKNTTAKTITIYGKQPGVETKAATPAEKIILGVSSKKYLIVTPDSAGTNVFLPTVGEQSGLIEFVVANSGTSGSLDVYSGPPVATAFGEEFPPIVSSVGTNTWHLFSPEGTAWKSVVSATNA